MDASHHDASSQQDGLGKQGPGIRTIDWGSLLKRHPMFSVLDADEFDALLSNIASREVPVEAGKVILQAGEWSTSVFIVGSGSVQVTLPKENGGELSLSPLGVGECFGEMAAIEQLPRSATVTAREASTLLEINGEDFVRLIKRHPDLEFKLLHKVSERLRRLGESILHNRLDSVTQRIELFASQLEAEKKGFAATRESAESSFRETEKRADDVIANAERNNQNWERALRLTTWIASGIGAIASALVIFLTWFGVAELKDITDIKNDVKKEQAFVHEVNKNLRAQMQAVNELDQKVEGFLTARRILFETLVPNAVDPMVELTASKRERLYRVLLTSGEKEIALDLLTGLWGKFVYVWDNEKRHDLLRYFEKDRSKLKLSPYEVRVMIDFVKATGFAIDNKEGYGDEISRLRRLIAANDYALVRSQLKGFSPEPILGVDDQSQEDLPAHLRGEVRELILAAWEEIP